MNCRTQNSKIRDYHTSLLSSIQHFKKTYKTKKFSKQTKFEGIFLPTWYEYQWWQQGFTRMVFVIAIYLFIDIYSTHSTQGNHISLLPNKNKKKLTKIKQKMYNSVIFYPCFRGASYDALPFRSFYLVWPSMVSSSSFCCCCIAGSGRPERSMCAPPQRGRSAQ